MHTVLLERGNRLITHTHAHTGEARGGVGSDVGDAGW